VTSAFTLGRSPILRAHLTAIVCFVAMVAQVADAQSGELKPPYPQVDRAFHSAYCEIEYTADKESDARQLAADADDSLNRMALALRPLDSQLMTHFDCTVVQFATPVAGVASAGQEQTQSDGGSKSFRVFLIALSSIPPASRTLVGENKDEDYSHKTIADELSSVLLERVTRDKKAGWHFYQAPDWFVQGIEGYFGITYSTPHGLNLTLPRYVAKVCSNPKEVGFKHGVQVGNSYLGGLVLVDFLYDTYGADKVNALLVSPKATFDEAFADTFGDFDSVRAQYGVWFVKECATR
jgi:hypothetical protein